MYYARLFSNSWQFTRDNKAVILLGGLTFIYVYVPQLESVLAYFAPESLLLISTLPRLLFTTGLYLVLIVLSLWGKTAIIHLVVLESTADLEQSDASTSRDKNILWIAKHMLGQANESMSRVLKFYLFSIFGVIPLYLLTLLISVSLAQTKIAFFADDSQIRSILLRVFLAILLLLWNPSIVALIVEKLEPLASLKRGGQIIIANLGRFISLCLFTYLPFALATIFLRTIVYAFYLSLDAGLYPAFTLIYGALLLLWFSAFSGFINVVWTQVFLQLTKPAETD